jgi:NhaP-type Na+/H+ or K+/H+ antiporter
MENYTIILFVLGVMIFLSAMADKIKVSAPILLICTGIAIGFIPGRPDFELHPEIIFLLFLPPLLYDAAFNISFKSFKDNISTISSLAIGLVFLTTAGIAVIAHFAIPGMTWPLSFVLGAILAATDAVTAMSITKNLGLSGNTNTILEGESLINVMAVLSFTVLTPFATYLLAEELNFSGVIAVVVLGFYISRMSATKFPEFLRHQSKTIWDMIVFILNGLIFILIGLEFPIVMHEIDSSLLLPYAGYAFLITIAALGIRMLRVLLKRKTLLYAFSSPKFKGTRREVPQSLLLTLQESVIIIWSGMRGIVSLAIALGLPKTLENGEPFPMRNAIIFITILVVLFTILGQGLLLPFLVSKNTKKL